MGRGRDRDQLSGPPHRILRPLKSPLALNAALLDELKIISDQLGFDHLAAAPVRIPAREHDAYLRWIKKGFGADMAYMTDDPAKRLAPQQTFPGAQTVLSLGVSYFQGDLPPKPGPAFGRVARYAWGADYHDVIGERLRQFVERLKLILGDVNCTLATDTKPVLERALAESAGLGFVGKNTVLIVPQGRHDAGPRFHVGSWLFLAEILIDIPLDAEAAPTPVPNGCGGCDRCLTVCPTNAFDGPYQLNAGRCIAYLTIENKGAIPREMRAALGDWLFGCDACQDVCPFNARSKQTRWPELEATHGVGAWMSLREIFSVPDQPSFKKKWGTSPLSRAKRRGLLRNACVVAGNSQDEALLPSIEVLIHDNEPLVRQHALWAYAKLARRDARAAVEKALRNDPDASIKKECDDLLTYDF